MPTERERRLWRRLRRKVRELEPGLSSTLLRGFRELRERLGVGRLADLIESTSLARILSEELSEEVVREVFRDFTNQIPASLEEATKFAAGAVPGLAASQVFNRLSPRIIDAIRTLETRVMTTLVPDIRETFRATVERGLEQGVNPRVIARNARSTIGLAPNQAQWVENFREELESGSRAALGRRLRDRRFDRTLEKALGPGGAGLKQSQIDRMVGRYRQRMVAFNAETNARTAALDAAKQGSRLAWQDGIEIGAVDATSLMKRWSSVGDSRVRPEHVEMDGSVVPFNETYPNGQMVPGDTEFSCRCIDIFFVAQSPIPTG